MSFRLPSFAASLSFLSASLRLPGLRDVRRRAGAALAAVALVAPAACTLPGPKGSSGNAPAASGGPLDAKPVIDEVIMPASVAVGSDGYYTLQGTISFHDPDNPVSLIRIHVPVLAKTFEANAGGAQEMQGEPFYLQLIGDFPLLHAGEISYEVTVVDAVGGESLGVTKTVVLQ